MQILSAASAFPKYYYPQDVLRRALEEYWGDELENPALMRRLQRHTCVDGRYLSLPLQAYTKLATWGETNDLWIQNAVELGRQAVCRALNQAGLAPRDLGAFFFTSVTGISSPSIDARLINRMGLSANIRRIPMFGLDCLRKTGNLSSASVLVVLEEVMKRRRPEPGTLGLLAAMGPGFCSELVLLRW